MTENNKVTIFYLSYTVTKDGPPRLMVKEITAQETQKSYMFPGHRLAKDTLRKMDSSTYDVPTFVRRFCFCLREDLEATKKDIVQVVNGVVTDMKTHVLSLEDWSKKDPIVTIKQEE